MEQILYQTIERIMNGILYVNSVHQTTNESREYFEQRPILNPPEDTVNDEAEVINEMQGVLIGELDADLQGQQNLLQRAVAVMGRKMQAQQNKQKDLAFDLAAAYARSW